MMQIEKQREEYYKQLGTPPGVPTMKGATADPDNTGIGYNSIITDLGDHSVPEGWIQHPKFNGKELDQETGLYYYGARYMNPVTSLWYGVDALMEKYPTIGGYVYCVGNPIKHIDPDGLSTWVVTEGKGKYKVIGGDLNDKDLNIYLYGKDKSGEYTMKKVIFIIIVIISVLLQYFFGKTRLYYYNSYNLFLLINEKNITNGELKISKNIFSFKNKIEFGHYGELPIFYMVPKNGQIYICDYRNNITKIHSEDIYLYYTKNDVKTKLSDKIIYITWDVIPVIYDAEKKTILNVQRLL